MRPTAEIVGIRGGYAGPGIKTIVPATVTLEKDGQYDVIYETAELMEPDPFPKGYQ